jgi:hypothetical protein
VTIFAEVGAIYINFGLWAISIFPAWLVLRRFGQGDKLARGEEEVIQTDDIAATKG